MLLSAVSVLVVAQSSSEIPEGLMNNPVYFKRRNRVRAQLHITIYIEIGVKLEKEHCYERVPQSI